MTRNGPDGETWFIVYHCWNQQRTKRQMFLDPIEWTSTGPKAWNPARGDKRVTLPLLSQQAE
ncbi:MAG: hypothetical protein JXA69_02130 [Phycisphaerae bacterium]|nr:hypothetical protein [Phycisphaerae bacterium]